LTLPASRPPARRHRRRLQPTRRCLFCGALATDTRLIDRLDQHVCEECFRRIGSLFSTGEYTPLRVRTATCISCQRTARARLLVAGVAAAICRRCYLTVKRRATAAPFEASVGRLSAAQSRDLNLSRAVRLRARRRFEQMTNAGRSLRRAERTTESTGLALEAALALRRMAPPLALVTSRDRVRGHPALKLGAGRAALIRVLLGRRSR
jgi:hypothetical protein